METKAKSEAYYLSPNLYLELALERVEFAEQMSPDSTSYMEDLGLPYSLVTVQGGEEHPQCYCT